MDGNGGCTLQCVSALTSGLNEHTSTVVGVTDHP